LKQVRSLLDLFRHRRCSTLNLSMMVDIRLSVVKGQRAAPQPVKESGSAQIGNFIYWAINHLLINPHGAV
jgi:hypothetical protein